MWLRVGAYVTMGRDLVMIMMNMLVSITTHTSMATFLNTIVSAIMSMCMSKISTVRLSVSHCPSASMIMSMGKNLCLIIGKCASMVGLSLFTECVFFRECQSACEDAYVCDGGCWCEYIYVCASSYE